jgi:hypothetical protein
MMKKQTYGIAVLVTNILKRRKIYMKNQNRRLYNLWSNMLQRCYNENYTGFQYYGEKGIVVIEEWEDFNNFKKWALDNGYEEHLVLHRKDTTKDYEPENCEWLTKGDHLAGGKGKEIKIEYEGKTITLSALSKITGICRETLKNRYLIGWSTEEIISKPHNGLRRSYQEALKKKLNEYFSKVESEEIKKIKEDIMKMINETKAS